MDMWLSKVMWPLLVGMLLLFPIGEAELTENQKQELLDKHNFFRAREGASDMRYMSWSQTLADKAQSWASGCRFEHDNTNYGENLWAHSSKTISDVTEAAVDWASEVNGYNYEGNKCDVSPCGHYTQVVWAKTHEVGCGLEVCDSLDSFGPGSGTYIVCNYNPAGNFGGRPFALGEPCTACDNGIYNCFEGMCRSDCSGGTCECKACEVCQNCATITESCSCQCPAGWAGNNCSDPCVNAGTGCSHYPKSDCNADSQWYSQMKTDCYAYCGFCEVGDAATDCSLSGQEFCGNQTASSGTETPTSGTHSPTIGTQTSLNASDSQSTDVTISSEEPWSMSGSPVLALSKLLLPVLLSACSVLSL